MLDTTTEIEDLQFDLMMKITPNERIAMACKMFESPRRLFLNSLPKDLSEREIKERLYFRTYGEHRPDDFFD